MSGVPWIIKLDAGDDDDGVNVTDDGMIDNKLTSDESDVILVK